MTLLCIRCVGSRSASESFSYVQKTLLVWFRQDLRLADNPALYHAVEAAVAVVPVFIWAPGEEGDWPPGGAHRWWLHHSLDALDTDYAGHRDRPDLDGQDLPDRYLHKPWEAPRETLEEAGIILGETYPEPIVDHGEARDRALEAYNAIK